MLNPEFTMKLATLIKEYTDDDINEYILAEMMTKTLLATLNYTGDLVQDKFGKIQ